MYLPTVYITHSFILWCVCPNFVLILGKTRSQASCGQPPRIASSHSPSRLADRFLIEHVDCKELIRSKMECRDIVDEAKRYHLGQARRLGGALGARALSPDPRASSPDPFTEEVRASRQKDSEGCVETPKYVPDIWLSCLLPGNVEKCVFVTVTLYGTGSGKR